MLKLVYGEKGKPLGLRAQTLAALAGAAAGAA